MVAYNMKVGFGLMTIDTKRETAKVTAPTIAYLCIGQPGKPAHEASPRRAPYHCDVCGKIEDNDVLVRGVKSGKTYTLIDGEAADEAKAEYAGQHTDMLKLVPHPAQDFLLQTGEGKALYYLVPADQSSANHYALLAALVERHPEVALAGLFTPRSATALFHLTARNGVLVMAERTRTDAMKPLPSVGGEINDQFLALLEGTLEQFTEPYDPEAYEDRYAATLSDLVDAGEVLAVDGTTTASVPAMTDDELMATLRVLQSDTAKKTTKKKAKAS